MRSKLVIEGDSVYEIDEECVYKKKEAQEEPIKNKTPKEETTKQT